MRQFDVLVNPARGEHPWAPYMVVLQSHHLTHLETTVVAPLIDDAGRPVGLVDVPVEFEGRDLVLAIGEMRGSALSEHRRSVGSLAAQEDDIRRALDKLFSGF
ncbi:Toxin CcdB [Caulobacteraceae bacterium]|jgi:toxin CcdB